jgi:hypothetical protein
LTTGSPGAVARGGLAKIPDFADTHAAFRHYSKHVRGVDLSNPAKPKAKMGGADMPEYHSFGEYRDAARSFHSGAPSPGVLEAVRAKTGDFVRFEPATGRFGVRTRSGLIRTYFRPDGSAADQMQYFLDQVIP